MQLAKYKIKRTKITHIFISHLHGDHYFGLIGLLTSMGLLNRTTDLHLHAPGPLKEILDLQLTAGAVLEQLAGTDREHGAPLRLLFGAIRDDDAAGRLLGRLRPADNDAVPQRPELHRNLRGDVGLL